MINHICSNCMGKMEQHQTLYDWRKCATCGYCIEIPRKFMITIKELNPNGESILFTIQFS